MTSRHNRITTTLAAWGFGIVFAATALAYSSSDANAQRITFRQSSAQFQDLRNDYVDERPRWHRRTHREDALWYHQNVSPDHRFLPDRFHGMSHDFDPFRQYARHNDDGRRGRVGRRDRNRRDHDAPTYAAPQIASRANSHGSTRAASQGCSSINAGTLFGAAIGGFVGSRIGGGSGNLAATAGGTLLGALIGGNAGCR